MIVSYGAARWVDAAKTVWQKLAHYRCSSIRCKSILSVTLDISGKVVKDANHSPYCPKCRARRWKAAHPLKYSFNKLRNRARERGKEFSLRFKEYERFAKKTKYDQLKGKSGLSLSIDRKDNSQGYYVGNIRAITISENSRKSHVAYFQRQMHGSEFLPDQTDIRLAEESVRQSLHE